MLTLLLLLSPLNSTLDARVTTLINTFGAVIP
jgi:hypothetical protein